MAAGDSINLEKNENPTKKKSPKKKGGSKNRVNGGRAGNQNMKSPWRKGEIAREKKHHVKHTRRKEESRKIGEAYKELSRPPEKGKRTKKRSGSPEKCRNHFLSYK